MALVSGYCMSCKGHSVMRDAKVVTTKGGRQFRKGSCAVCRSNMSRAMGIKKTSFPCPQCDKYQPIPDGDYICLDCRKEWC